MTSSKSSPRRDAKSSSKPKTVSAFDLFYQLTYMSAMAAAGLTRSKTFQIAAASPSPVSAYFVAINNLVEDMRYDYPEACRRIGEKAKTDEMKSFLLRLSDALRSGEPLADFLAREAAVQGSNYRNAYERDIESLKQWTDAFSSIVVSVALIVIIQVVSSMIYSMDVTVMAGLVTTAVVIGFFGAWIISRAAPQEVKIIALGRGSIEQIRALNLAKLILPVCVVASVALALAGVSLGWVLILAALVIFPVGITSLLSDRKTVKKEEEYSTFLRSIGGMATSSGTTLKEALTRIDLSSFPTLQPDITRLSTRLQALVSPEICWSRFGHETGSQLISDATDIFYSAVTMGGDPEHVGYLCSLFSATTTQLRAKRRLVAGTFTGLTLVMQGIVAALMIFVLEVVNNFVKLMNSVMVPDDPSAADTAINMGMGLVSFTPEQLKFLSLMTVAMVILLAAISAVAILAADGGYKLKFAFFLSMALVISGLSFLVVPPLVAQILTL